MTKEMESLQRWLDRKTRHETVTAAEKASREGIEKAPVGFMGEDHEQAMFVSAPANGGPAEQKKPTDPVVRDFLQAGDEHGHKWSMRPEALVGKKVWSRELAADKTDPSKPQTKTGVTATKAQLKAAADWLLKSADADKVISGEEPAKRGRKPKVEKPKIGRPKNLRLTADEKAKVALLPEGWLERLDADDIRLAKQLGIISKQPTEVSIDLVERAEIAPNMEGVLTKLPLPQPNPPTPLDEEGQPLSRAA
jgi:hypothetical protein